jgi:hypothetical protein
MARDLPDQPAPGGRDPGILDAAQAAAYLEFPDPQAVTELAAAGELPGSKVGRGWLFHQPALRGWRARRWPALYQRIAGPGVPDGPVLSAAQLAARLGFRDPQTVTDLAAAGELAGCKVGRGWLFAWVAIYQRIAGPGVPDGEVLSAAQLAARIGASSPRVVRRAAGPPGTPGTLPGCRIGKQWLFALEAVLADLDRQPEAAPAGSPALR